MYIQTKTRLSEMSKELRGFWEEFGILKLHSELMESGMFVECYDRVMRTEGEKLAMVNYRGYPWEVKVQFVGGEVENFFDIVRGTMVQVDIIVFKSEEYKRRYGRLAVTDNHWEVMERWKSIKEEHLKTIKENERDQD